MVDNCNDYELEINPRQCFVLKNIGKDQNDALLMSSEILKKAYRRIRLTQIKGEEAARRWLIRGFPGAHIDELVLETHQSIGLRSTARMVLRVKAGPYWGPGQAGAGPVVVEIPGVRIKVV